MPSAFEALPILRCATTALFLDFDGTLTPIVGHPDQVHVDAKVVKALSKLATHLEGALAVISGREIKDLDGFFSPHVFPASGVHGLEHRIKGSGIQRIEINRVSLETVIKQLDQVTASHNGLLLERKCGSVALHYRARPDLSDECRRAVANAVADQSGLTVIEGKMVIEVKGHSGSKGSAIETYMKQPPFHERTPVFIGDDVTDEAGFVAVNSMNGISIKVGDGATAAQYRLGDTAGVAEWLTRLLKQCESSAVAREMTT